MPAAKFFLQDEPYLEIARENLIIEELEILLAQRTKPEQKRFRSMIWKMTGLKIILKR